MLYQLSYTLAGGGTRTRNIRGHVVSPAFAGLSREPTDKDLL